jgi:DNA-binding beta-propeller fold protein YncE
MPGTVSSLVRCMKRVMSLCLFVVCAALLAGCDEDAASTGKHDKTWGRRGLAAGWLQKPRAIAIDGKDQLYIVDMTARIQVFTPDGEYLRGWQTPEFKNGKPSGLSFANDGNLLVADTHYYRMLVYTPEGKLLEDRTIGGTNGQGPGEFGFVTHAVQDSQGNYYIAEYGEYDRIQKFSPEGKFLLQFGGHGSESGQFIRPQKMALDKQNHVWVADACNHRIQVFDATGSEAKLIKIWGEQGSEPGKLSYPYGIILDNDKDVYIAEFGNHRVQKFTPEGKSLGTFGVAGRGEGQLHQPWGLVQDSQGRLHVLDTYNHRVTRCKL